MNAESAQSQSPEVENTAEAKTLTAEDIIGEFKASGDRISDLVNTLIRDKKDLTTEITYAKDRETRLTEEIKNLRNVAERLDNQMLKFAELDRKHRLQQETAKLTEDELDAKSQALSQLKSEYKEAIDKLSHATIENDSFRIRCSDLERKQEQLHELTESLNVALSDKKRALGELEAKLFEQTGVLSETQAKFADAEVTLERLSEQLITQGKEMKEAKWETLELQEELRVLKLEFTRKSTLIVEREKELDTRAETIREQQEQIASLEAEVRRSALRIAKNEENLSSASQKISAQSTAVVQLERTLVRAQQELEKRELTIRNLEDKARLTEDDLAAVERELGRFREIANDSKQAVQDANQRAEELNGKLLLEVRQRMDAIKLRDDIRLELASTREKAIQLQQSLAQLTEINAHLNEQLRLVRGDFDSLDSEHKSVLRTEAHQSYELENTSKDLANKSELLRELQSQNASLREKLDIMTMKLDQQSSSAEDSRKKAIRLQDEIANLKKAAGKVSDSSQDQLEIEELKHELESKELLLRQQDQLIQVLQTRVAEKRVVPIGQRDPAAAPTPPDTTDDRQHGNLRRF